MKPETGIVILKGLGYIIVGVGTALASTLAQYANSEAWPSRIIWWGVVIPSCMVAGANSLLSFLSGSVSEYLKNRNGNTPPKP